MIIITITIIIIIIIIIILIMIIIIKIMIIIMVIVNIGFIWNSLFCMNLSMGNTSSFPLSRRLPVHYPRLPVPCVLFRCVYLYCVQRARRVRFIKQRRYSLLGERQPHQSVRWTRQSRPTHDRPTLPDAQRSTPEARRSQGGDKTVPPDPRPSHAPRRSSLYAQSKTVPGRGQDSPARPTTVPRSPTVIALRPKQDGPREGTRQSRPTHDRPTLPDGHRSTPKARRSQGGDKTVPPDPRPSHAPRRSSLYAQSKTVPGRGQDSPARPTTVPRSPTPSALRPKQDGPREGTRQPRPPHDHPRLPDAQRSTPKA